MIAQKLELTPDLTDPATVRRYLDAIIDRAIAMRDALDGDCDLEEGGDFEPWLATTALEDRTGNSEIIHALRCRIDLSDREAEDEHDEADDDSAVDDRPCDCDPAQDGDLGWPEGLADWVLDEFSTVRFPDARGGSPNA